MYEISYMSEISRKLEKVSLNEVKDMYLVKQSGKWRRTDVSEISYMPEISMKLEKVSLNEVEDMNLLKNEQQIESIIL